MKSSCASKNCRRKKFLNGEIDSTFLVFNVKLRYLPSSTSATWTDLPRTLKSDTRPSIRISWLDDNLPALPTELLHIFKSRSKRCYYLRSLEIWGFSKFLRFICFALTTWKRSVAAAFEGLQSRRKDIFTTWRIDGTFKENASPVIVGKKWLT